MGVIMSKVSPFHSVKEPKKQVYHNNNKCEEGNNIEKQYLRSGTDNRNLCSRCKELNDQGK